MQSTSLICCCIWSTLLLQLQLNRAYLSKPFSWEEPQCHVDWTVLWHIPSVPDHHECAGKVCSQADRETCTNLCHYYNRMFCIPLCWTIWITQISRQPPFNGLRSSSLWYGIRCDCSYKFAWDDGRWTWEISILGKSHQSHLPKHVHLYPQTGLDNGACLRLLSWCNRRFPEYNYNSCSSQPRIRPGLLC